MPENCECPKGEHTARCDRFGLIGSYGIRAVKPSTPGAFTCGTCGLAWMEETPASRCPFEGAHEEPEPEEDVVRFIVRVDAVDSTHCVIDSTGWERPINGLTEQQANDIASTLNRVSVG